MLTSYKNDPHRKGKSSQDIVSTFLRNRGFIVDDLKKVTENGIDIVALKSNKRFFVEVKTPIYSTRSWRVKKPTTGCDYIAIVMPNGMIHFDSLENWSKLCDKNGTRFITKLVTLYELL